MKKELKFLRIHQIEKDCKICSMKKPEQDYCNDCINEWKKSFDDYKKYLQHKRIIKSIKLEIKELKESLLNNISQDGNIFIIEKMITNLEDELLYEKNNLKINKEKNEND